MVKDMVKQLMKKNSSKKHIKCLASQKSDMQSQTKGEYFSAKYLQF